MAHTLSLGSEQKGIIALAVAGAVLPTLAVSLRIWARRIANRRLNSSDYLIIPACTFAVTYQIYLIASIKKIGLSYHVADVVENLGRDTVTEFLKVLFSYQLIYTVSIAFTKLSILELYRILIPKRALTIACYVTQSVVIAWAVATVFVTIFICDPIAYNWDTSIEGGHCGDVSASWTSTGIVNILTDILVLVLPVYDLSKIQMARYKKVVLIAVFALGIFTTAVGIARLVAILRVDYEDITFGVVWAAVFSALECSVAVTLSCIPLLRPLLGRSRYSKTGTARVRSTWKDVLRTVVTGRKNDNFELSNDDTWRLELRPPGAAHTTYIAKSDSPGIGQEASAMSQKDIYVRHEWNVS